MELEEVTVENNYHDHIIRVSYADTDQMGIVYYSNYFVYMENGRTEWLRSRGWTYRDMERQGIFLPVLHASCDYYHPARYDDLLRVRTVVEELSRLRINFRYEISCDRRGELLAEGSTSHVFMDPDGKPKRVGEEVIIRLKGLAAAEP